MAAARKSQATSMRQVASADEASDSEEIDVCETCSEWLSKALLCSCQVPSSASSSPSQGHELSKTQPRHYPEAAAQPPRHYADTQPPRGYPKSYQQAPARSIVRS